MPPALVCSWNSLKSVGETVGNVYEIDDLIVSDKNRLARTACHILVEEIPDDGLQELCESISSIFKFHIELPPQAVPALLDSPRIQVELTQPYERPELQIAEE